MHDDERTPPTRIRVTRLQEAQLAELVQIDEAAAIRCHEAGVDPAAVKPRSDVEIAQLHRTHDVYVAEADHEVAAYLAWRDVPPKIALLDILCVAPELQRFGVGSRLLREMGERCVELDIELAVARCWQEATWAMAFLMAAGFRPATSPGAEGQTAPTPPLIHQWQQRHAKPEDLPGPGELLLWRNTTQMGVKVIPGVPLPG